jgi:hypothetical protein
MYESQMTPKAAITAAAISNSGRAGAFEVMLTDRSRRRGKATTAHLSEDPRNDAHNEQNQNRGEHPHCLNFFEEVAVGKSPSCVAGNRMMI